MDVTFTETKDKAPESSRVGESLMLNCVEQPPDVLQSVRIHSSTCTWLTFTRSSDCSCGETGKGRRGKMSETKMGITVIVSEGAKICISSVGG